MKLYDSLSKKIKVLKPRSGKKIEIFVCGPTVYDYSHIGHARTYIAFDAFVKYLRSQNYDVRYVQNITDIDDKIITRAKEIKESPEQLARTFETEYHHDMESLGITAVDKYARATNYIKHIINQIERLLEKKYAYEIKGDGIYYDISKFKEYGKLSGRTAQQAEDAVSRIDESVKKQNKGDFALWKFSKPNEPIWNSPWGKGRPGWHIEDTAITEEEFQEQYDIHGGARDLIFPHHESEIAQMEALSAKEPLVNHWMHTGFLTINGEKMAKSLGNFVTIHKFLEKYSKETFRLFILSSHYRSPIDYSEKAVKQAETNVRRLTELSQKLEKLTTTTPVKAETIPAFNQQKHRLSLFQYPKTARKNYEKKLNDDFNTPKALAIVFSLMRDTNSLLDKNELTSKNAKNILSFLKNINDIFGIIPPISHIIIPKRIKDFAKKRKKLRDEKKWNEADKVRIEIERMGYTIDDTSTGSQIKKIK